ncbi:MAG: stage III sporulation protein AD [Clostridiales bacterium]|jgi:stage III sporulation protein AD|nr:stage III sporulation protein AD [Clostridiales bacterium]
MDSLIIKACAAGIIAVFLALTLKKETPAIALAITMAVGVFILLMILPRLEAVMGTLETVAAGVSGGGSEYIGVAVKVIGIAWVAEFGSNVCADAGEAGVASKIELAGKVLIMAVSAPIVLTLLERVIALL